MEDNGEVLRRLRLDFAEIQGQMPGVQPIAEFIDKYVYTTRIFVDRSVSEPIGIETFCYLRDQMGMGF